MQRDYYKKTGLAATRIARAFLALSVGERIPTIQEFVQSLGAARGTVQSALTALEAEGAVRLEKRGKMGSYIAKMDLPALFRLADLSYITGSMPAPISLTLAGLATGICRAMSACPVPFTFAFVQGAGNRVEALRRMVYDFVVVSQAAARHHTGLYPELEIAAVLEQSRYSAPYVLYCNRPGADTLRDGFSIAVDPTSTDQWQITGQLCAGRDVRIVTCPYIATRAAFLAREVDCVVYRAGDIDGGNGVRALPLPAGADEAQERPAVLVNRNNYGISSVLHAYLDDAQIANAQQAVVDMRAEPQFY